MNFSIFLGDIADAPADAVCTSTNPRLSLMMGTGASIRARGGPDVMRACATHRPLAAGSVYATTAGELPQRVLIHCVASDASHRSSAAIVRACVLNALTAAETAGCTTIALPILGTGHARLRFADAVRAMAQAALAAVSQAREVMFVTNDEERVSELQKLLQEIADAVVRVDRSTMTDEEPTSLWSDDYALLPPR